jgi:uncharacterized membrane protein
MGRSPVDGRSVTRILVAWEAVRDSLWFPAALMTGAAVALAFVTVQLDGQLGRTQFYLAFLGGVEGSRSVLGVIGGSAITVTGTIFSITIIALQLASTQYTPRVLHDFTSDRGNQVVLGVFIATFTYSLLILRTIHGPDGGVDQFVPSLSVAVAILLALISVGFLIYFIHHVTRSIQVWHIVDRPSRDTIALVERLFPEHVGRPGAAPKETEVGRPGVVTARGSGYLQAVDAEALFRLEDRPRLVVRMELRLGDFVLPGAMLASVWPAAAMDRGVREAIRQAFVVGAERTLRDDVEFGVQQIADVAIRALSPGVNDPTTAVHCIDRLAEVVTRLGIRPEPESVRTDSTGRVAFIARPTSFERVVALAFDQIRHYGVGDPRVAAHLLEMLGRIRSVLSQDRHGPIARQIGLVLRTARTKELSPEDLARLEALAQQARGGPEAGPSEPGAATPVEA